MTMPYDMIISIVSNGWGDEIVDDTRKAGAEGRTVLYGRGTRLREQTSFFEPVLRASSRASQLEKPGTGIAFVLPVAPVAGTVDGDTP